MTEPNWRPLFRSPSSTITKVLHSPAFINSRSRAGLIISDAMALRALIDSVAALDFTKPPLSAIADRITAALHLLRNRAEHLDSGAPTPPTSPLDPDTARLTSPVREPAFSEHSAAGVAARERLIIAALHYLVTPVDLVPDFRAGGYVDDLMLLSWVFGAAVYELEPFLEAAPEL